MISPEERAQIIRLVKREVVPAIGCTEPIAVALCVAKAAETLACRPEQIEVRLSANILKNAMGVGIPGTGMIGLPIAVALGALIGRSAYQLEVLKDCTPQAVAEGRQFIDEKRIHISLKQDIAEKLYIEVVCRAQGCEATAIIAGGHTRFVFVAQDDKVLLDARTSIQGTTQGDEEVPLSLQKVFDFATTAPLDEIRFILDARMAGAMIPVMSNSGSGNQGISATLPVVIYAEETGKSEEELIRALMLSHLTVIYIKQSLGRLSALCGCVVAATGSSCGITWLMGGDYRKVSFAVQNMIANLTGMICDGAKPSCALKVTTGVSTAVLSAVMAMEDRCVTSVEGIIDKDVDRSIHNLTQIGSQGMNETDRLVLDIMTSKR